MQTGKIRSYHSEKRYGFIQGDDGESYFFHRNNVREEGGGIEKNKLVSFDSKPTPKGMSAYKIEVQEPVGVVYTMPDSQDTIFSRTMQCGKNNTAVHLGNRFTCEARSPDTARMFLKSAARTAGFNAVLNVERSQYTYSGLFDGNYQYTVHSFTGIPALVRVGTPSMDHAAVEASRGSLEEAIGRLQTVESEIYGEGEWKVLLSFIAFGIIAAAIAWFLFVR